MAGAAERVGMQVAAKAAGPEPKEKGMSGAVSQLVADLFHTRTVAHMMHLATKSYAQHKALESYYEEIPDLVDAFAEAYQGQFGLLNVPDEYKGPAAKEPAAYMNEVQTSFAKQRKVVGPDHPDLNNLLDEIANLISSTCYKLNNLS